MNRDRSRQRAGRVPWRALATAVVWLALAAYGQGRGAKPGGRPAAAPGPQGAMAVDLGGGVSLELVLVAPGSFSMGDAEAKPVHPVTISKPFYLGKYEVTQEQWQAVMGTAPSTETGPKLPVTNVTWRDCRQFLTKLNAKVNGKAPAQAPGKAGEAPAPQPSFRLPTEAEWEYACRAGTTTAFCCGDSDVDVADYAWLDGDSGGTTHEVGTKKPNAWGLYDMHGNVWEWCADWYGAYAPGAATDPAGPEKGKTRVHRGGGWNFAAVNCRSASRGQLAPGSRYDRLGLRVVLVPAAPP